MTRSCMGCNRDADRQVKGNDSLFICTPCTQLLPGIRTNRIVGVTFQCIECGTACFHGQKLCTFCLADVIRWLDEADQLDDNPFLYELVLPLIRFYQSLDLESPPMGEDWYMAFLKGQPRMIRFTNIVYQNA
jgi:hypothetical protein